MEITNIQIPTYIFIICIIMIYMLIALMIKELIPISDKKYFKKSYPYSNQQGQRIYEPNIKVKPTKKPIKVIKGNTNPKPNHPKPKQGPIGQHKEVCSKCIGTGKIYNLGHFACLPENGYIMPYCDCEIGQKINNIKRNDGLLADEGEVMDSLVVAWNKYIKLEKQHPSEINDFADGIHKCQQLLSIRIARRHYPKGWPKK